MKFPLRLFVFAGSSWLCTAGLCSAQAFQNGFESSGTSGGVHALTVFNGAMHASGTFESAGTAVAGGIARWNGVLGTWSSLSGGVDGHVSALAVYDEPGPTPARLFAAGEFTLAGASSVRNIARWDGSTWSAVGTGVNGTDDAIYALAVYDDDGAGPRPPALYAGGVFEHASSGLARHIARWDGSVWQPLANGVDGPVTSLAVFDPDGAGSAGSELIAGGFFATAGSASAPSIARWNGTTWSALGGGVSGSASRTSVNALAVYDPDGSGGAPPQLYLGGSFTFAGGTPASGIASWNGSAYAPVGSGITAAASFPNVRALGVFDEDGAGPQPTRLYIAGLFRSAGGVSAVPTALDPAPLLTVARWDGAVWSALGAGLANNANSVGRALTFFDDDLNGSASVFVGGQFTAIGSGAASGVARWSGANWQALGTGKGAGSSVLALATTASVGAPVYAGGSFKTAGSAIAHRVARWDDTTSSWSALGNGLDGTVRALELAGPNLYAGGDFLGSAGVAAAHVAFFDGASWNSVGGGTNGPVHALKTYQGALVAGGIFEQAGGVACANIARLVGSTWQPLGVGLNGIVRALEVFNDGSGESLYAGGDFTTAGGVSATGVARWNGSAWLPVGQGLCCGGVFDLQSIDLGSGSQLYAAGDIDLGQNGRVDGVVRWNASLGQWQKIGSGVSGGAPTNVRALGRWSHGGSFVLAVGGNFGTIDGLAARNVATFDGVSWSPLGSGLDQTVHTLGSIASIGGPAPFAGGDFGVADGIPSAFLARKN